MKYILSLDQGTTSSRAIIYDENFRVVSVGQRAFPQHYPQNGWVEHDLEEIWESVRSSVTEALGAAKSRGIFHESEIACIGITNQRETFGVWEKATGKPVAPAIVWQCRRSAEICKKLSKSAAGKKIPAITGLVLDPYFSGTKVKWMLDENPALKKRAANGELAFGNIDTFLMWRLTGGTSHVTDVTNASRTLFMDLKTRTWSAHCLKTLGVPASMLPEIRDSDAVFGKTTGLGFLPNGIPITGVLGDQQAALFGQECLNPGEAKVTYGTGAFLLLNTGSSIRRSKGGLSTVAWRCRGKTTYALEGSVFIAGAAVQWIRDGLGLVATSAETQGEAEKVKDADGVFFIPALSGLGSPYWAPEAKGLIGGITRRTTKAHVVRACLEGISHSVADLLSFLQKDSGVKLKELRVDGGASLNSVLLQSQADLMGVTIRRPADIESTARGAAYIAAVGAGLRKDPKDLRGKNPVEAEFTAQTKPAERKAAMDLWRRRVKALLAGCF